MNKKLVKKPKYTRKPRNAGRRRAKRYGAKAGSMAYSAYKMARKLMDAVNIEYKYLDVAANATFDYNGALVNVSNLSRGTDDSSRIGDSVKAQNLTIRGHLVNSNSCAVRMIVFWDKQSQVTAASNLLAVTGSFYSPFSPKLYDTRFRSKILLDKSWSLFADKPIIQFEEVFSINDHIQYNGSASDQLTGGLKVLFISDQTGGTVPTYTLYSRMTYTDN